MSAITQLVTAEEFLHTPKEQTWRTELIEGVITKMSPAGMEHGDIAATIAALLWQHVKAQKLGRVMAAETGFKLASDPDTVLAPDTAFIRQEEFERLGMTKKFWPGAPDLAVEVMSPDDSVRRTDEKAKAWLSYGTRMVWVINPRQRTISVYRNDVNISVLTENGILEGYDIVPGFRCSVSEIFG